MLSTVIKREDFTYWAESTRDGFGKITYVAPVTDYCKYSDEKEIFRTDSGDEKVSKSVFVTELEVKEQGYVLLGEQSVVADPMSVSGARRIVGVDKTTTFGGETIYKGYLI